MSGALKTCEDTIPQPPMTDTKKPHKLGTGSDSLKNSVHPISTDDEQQQTRSAALTGNERAPLLKGSCKNDVCFTSSLFIKYPSPIIL